MTYEPQPSGRWPGFVRFVAPFSRLPPVGLNIETASVAFTVVNSQFPIALPILGFLAARGGGPLTSEVLADTYGTSPVVLRRVLAKLQRAGLVETRRGAHGGSVLGRDPSTINLRQAYEAVNADPQVLARHPECDGRVERAMAEFVNGLMGDAEAALLAQLEAVTFEEMDRHVRSILCGEPLKTRQ